MERPPVTLTELRQQLFQLADRVIETGEPLTIVRRGVQLRLSRADVTGNGAGRLRRLVAQEVVIGPPLRPDESPAQWQGEGEAWPKVTEAGAEALPHPSGRRR